MRSERTLRVLVILNSIGGGATQGIKEMMMSMPTGKIDFYLIFPEDPSEVQADWLKKYASGWKTVKLNWWNKNLHLPLIWRFARFVIDNFKSVFRIRHIVALFMLVKKWNIDIVYTATSLNIEGAIVAKLCNKPHVWHLKETFGRGGRVKFPIPDSLVPKLFLLLSNKVLVMTHYIRSFFGDDASNEKIMVVNDSVSIDKFVSSGNEFRQKLGVRPTDILVANVASLSSIWKQHELFLELASSFKVNSQVKFAMFGSEPKKYANPIYNAPWNYYRSLREKADRLNLNGSLIWGGFHSNIPELMSSIDILVHTCDTEPFGRIAIEAMAAGKSVIGPDAGGVSETIIDNETGLKAKSGSVESFTQVLNFLINDSEERARLGKNAKRYVSNGTYNQDVHNEKMLKILSSLKLNVS